MVCAFVLPQQPRSSSRFNWIECVMEKQINIHFIAFETRNNKIKYALHSPLPLHFDIFINIAARQIGRDNAFSYIVAEFKLS